MAGFVSPCAHIQLQLTDDKISINTLFQSDVMNHWKLVKFGVCGRPAFLQKLTYHKLTGMLSTFSFKSLKVF